jgi:SWI/SNF-related matrix-associated actin-dependent regulator of chromatin subfamily A-like protein 1
MSNSTGASDMFTNKFAGTCNNPTCNCKVEAQAGYTQKINNRWAVWCKKCVPGRIEAAPRRILTTDGKIITPYEPQNLDLLRSIPGARWDKDNHWWSVSLEMANRRRLLEVAEKIGLEVPPSLRIVEVTEEAQNATNAGLYPFQVEGVNFLAHKDRALLGDEMGLGKSVQSLMGIPANGAALVICRAGLKYNWLDEVNKWRPDLKPVVLSGRKSFRWPTSGEVVIINNDILPGEFNTPKKNSGEAMEAYWERLKTYRNELKERHPQSANVNLIVDEVHDYKNREAARSRKVKEFSKLARKLTGLTGSPLTNRPEDLFGVLDVLGLAKEVFGTWERFQLLFNAYSERVWTGRGYINKIVWGKPQPIVPELLRRAMLRRRRADVLPDLPTKTYTNLTTSLDSTLQKSLDEMWEEWGTAVQIDGELPPFEKFSELREKLARSRVDAMIEYIENAEEQEVPLVVFSAHLGPLDALLGRPGWAVISGVTSPLKRQEIVRAFQAGQLKGVGVSIKAGGVGINLTHAWKALFVDLDWTPAANWQAEDRIARIGQLSNKVEIIRMVSNHPLDLHIHNMLVDKIDTIIKAIDSSVHGEKIEVKPGSQGETEEEFQARINKLLERAEADIEDRKARAESDRKIAAKGKVGVIHSREKARLTKKVLPLTAERTEAVRDSFKYMLSVCDGAHAWDNVGFNKPDASVAHWLLSAGLETDQEVEAAYYMLTRYHRQLAPKYPVLFK